MDDLVLFCKSYDKDMLRAKRMAESVQLYNVDNLNLYMCVPNKDLTAFKGSFKGIQCNFVTDEDVLLKSSFMQGDIPPSYPSHLIQQLVKLEFWRMNYCQNYVWIDSDCYFIKDFYRSDFIAEKALPYTIQHQSEELFSFASTYDDSIIESFCHLANKFSRLFNRIGPSYNFGYAPLIWSSIVLESLYEDYLLARNETIYSLLLKYPCEMQLYGEYAHYCRKIPIFPKKPLFKVYHYAEQFLRDQMNGYNDQSLSKEYLGVVMQSNWASPSGKSGMQWLRQKIRKYRKRLRFFMYDKVRLILSI